MFFDQVFYNNTFKSWITVIIIAILVLIGLRIVKSLLHRRILSLAKRTKTDIDDMIAGLIDKIKLWFLIYISIYTGSLYLSLPGTAREIMIKLLIISLLFQGAIWGSEIITYWLKRYQNQKMEEDAASATTFSALGFVSRLILWSVISLLALDNLGINVTALVAGLGVGGIAVALAVQNVLGDLFASLSIILDKPFVLGDFIIIDSYMGTIEHIGLKTTRIRSLSGEQLVFSNSDLLNSRIRNYKRMSERRVVFSLGVIYQTSANQLKAIPEMIKDIITKQNLARFDRAHFKDFGDSSLNFEIVYWMESPDYNVYMDTQQGINLEIIRKFDENKIEFAYPTQTLFMEKQ
ncbi:MAG: mechanosensitive ion channel family protein [Calditrichaceae bacterium]